MTVLEAFAILEAGVLECKKRDIDTPEMREGLDFIPEYRDHVIEHDRTSEIALEGQQQNKSDFPWFTVSIKELAEWFGLEVARIMVDECLAPRRS
jgi:hypothetical protein